MFFPDLERGAAVQPLGQDRLRNGVRILQHGLVRVGRTDGADDTLTDPGQDRLFPGSTDEAVDVSPDGDAGDRDQLNPVLGHGRDSWRLDDLRIHRHLDGLEHVTAGEVDRRGLFEPQRNIRLVGRDQCVADPRHVTAGQVVSLEFVHVQRDTRFGGGNQGADDSGRVYLPKPHTHKAPQSNADAACESLDPQANRHRPGDHHYEEESEEYGEYRPHGRGLIHSIISRY
jgi:hypothetical protein